MAVLLEKVSQAEGKPCRVDNLFPGRLEVNLFPAGDFILLGRLHPFISPSHKHLGGGNVC